MASELELEDEDVRLLLLLLDFLFFFVIDRTSVYASLAQALIIGRPASTLS